MSATGHPRTRRTVRRLAVVLGVLAAYAAISVTPAIATGEVLGDLDNRSGSLEPTAQQRQMVTNMGAIAEWSSFGTPSSVVKPNGYLATGLSRARRKDGCTELGRLESGALSADVAAESRGRQRHRASAQQRLRRTF